MIDKEAYPNLTRLFDHFSDRKVRAKERLKTNSQAGWYFGIIGLELSVSSYELLPEVATLEEVLEPPEESELVCALKEQHLFGAIGRYTQGIRHQIKMVALGCCRFQRHRVRCMNETGDGAWSNASLRESSDRSGKARVAQGSVN